MKQLHNIPPLLEIGLTEEEVVIGKEQVAESEVVT